MSSLPDLGTGLGGWDLVLRKLAHVAEYAILGALLLRATERVGLAFVLGALYAVSDELHQSFVPGRTGSPLDVAIDAFGVAAGVAVWHVARARSRMTPPTRAVALDLDRVLGDTRPLWDAWLDAAADVLEIRADTLPEDRARAAAELDARGAGNWRTLLERFAEERVAVHLRRDAAASEALRGLAADGVEVGVFTDAPEVLADVVLRHLGADRRVAAVETGQGALERLLGRLGPETTVLRTRTELEAWPSAS